MTPAIRRLAGLLLAALLLAGCTSPPSAAAAGEGEIPDAAGEQGTKPALRRAPSMGGPLPAERVPSPVAIDTTCKVDADCAVKNVGNCCGAMPACVHRDSPTDPAAVQAACARKGMASVCGFREISACTCQDGRCRDASRAGLAR